MTALHGPLIWAFLGLAAAVAMALLRMSAPYGRHARSGWGPAVPARLGWLWMEAPAPLLFGALLLSGGGPRDPATWVFLGLWEIHYLHRAFAWPLRLRGNRRPIPLSVVGMGFVFNAANAWLNGAWLGGLGPGYPDAWLLDPRFLLGVGLFAAGFAVNQHADRTLLALRPPGEAGYAIPHGGLFRWVSCPNYLGEILEWTGFALATWSLPGLAFAAWTAANLVPRALSHHRWYRAAFPGYPVDRRAIVPFLL